MAFQTVVFFALTFAITNAEIRTGLDLEVVTKVLAPHARLTSMHFLRPHKINHQLPHKLGLVKVISVTQLQINLIDSTSISAR
ncbi:hypothetical protein [Caldimonas brevitalea]|uniref:Uncharacterized protein n=1 Tax=Caldimonas brevitalea TaxID=413882 RepID=A0A0G3BN16_9BURK|nr:hypothetical protein AAW51_4096 [Caldimonas brevitalea]